jgi:DNA polymerase III subunit alpha
VYLADARAMGIKVLTPTSTGRMPTSPAAADELPAGGDAADRDQPGAITFGLSAVRNVGEGLVELLVAERESNGPFESFYDFAERVPEPVLNKRTVESLVKAGAFDSWATRAGAARRRSSRSSTTPWCAAASATRA